MGLADKPVARRKIGDGGATRPEGVSVQGNAAGERRDGAGGSAADRSEDHSGAELQLARSTRTEDAADVRRAEDPIGHVEVDAVQEIDDLAAELEADAARQRDVLLDRQVDVRIAGREDAVALGAAEGERRRQREAIRVEPLRRRAGRAGRRMVMSRVVHAACAREFRLKANRVRTAVRPLAAIAIDAARPKERTASERPPRRNREDAKTNEEHQAFVYEELGS
jgi:hypothetical protein